MKYLYSKITFVLILMTAVTASINGQSRKKQQNLFKAGLTAGMTLSQLDGDDRKGYGKRGLIGGVEAWVTLKGDNKLGISLLYNQKGAKIDRGNSGTYDRRDLSVNYISIPIIFTTSFESLAPKTFFEIGPIVNRVVNTSSIEEFRQVEVPSFIPIQSDFARTEIAALIGLGYRFTDKFGIKGRFEYGLTYLYQLEGYGTFKPTALTDKDDFIGFLRNYGLNFMLYYEL